MQSSYRNVPNLDIVAKVYKAQTAVIVQEMDSFKLFKAKRTVIEFESVLEKVSYLYKEIFRLYTPSRYSDFVSVEPAAVVHPTHSSGDTGFSKSMVPLFFWVLLFSSW